METFGGKYLEPIIKVSVVIFATLSVFFFPSLIKILPILQIKHLSVNTKDKRLKAIIERLLNREYSNNYLILYLNRENFEESLREKTEFFVEGVEKINFNWRSGSLTLILNKNRPIAILNNKFLVGENGRLFGFKKAKPKVKIFDKTAVWDYGDIYQNVDLKEVQTFNEIYVERYKYIAVNDRAKLILPRDSVKTAAVEKVLSLPGGFREANLLSKKNVYVKIFKE